MNLQERIVRWRGLGAFYEEKQCSALGDTVPTPGTVAIQCAAELEADLRELRALAASWSGCETSFGKVGSERLRYTCYECGYSMTTETRDARKRASK